MKKAYILSGLPGSGKSTFAKNLPGAFICSADDFRVREDGKYIYEPEKNEEVMRQCMEQFAKGCLIACKTVVCDNTNTTIRAMEFYVSIAKMFNYDVSIIGFKVSLEIAKIRNIHNVPEETLIQMEEQLKTCWSNIPAAWGGITIREETECPENN